jgi:hypothetical protein
VKLTLTFKHPVFHLSFIYITVFKPKFSSLHSRILKSSPNSSVLHLEETESFSNGCTLDLTLVPEVVSIDDSLSQRSIELDIPNAWNSI